MKYIKNIKMQVQPEQTREISKIVLDNGGCWGNKTKENNWLIITVGGDIEWCTDSNIKCYSACIAQDWIDDYYSKVPKAVEPKQSKYNFKFLEENKVALHIPTVELAEDFLIELSEYRKFDLDVCSYGLTYFDNCNEYFSLFQHTLYKSMDVYYCIGNDYKIISWDDFTTKEDLEDYIKSPEIKMTQENKQPKELKDSIPEDTIVLAKRNDGYSTQGKYFGFCNGKHIIDFNGTSAMLYDSVESLPTLTKKEAKQKISELFANPKNVTSEKIRNIIDLIKD